MTPVSILIADDDPSQRRLLEFWLGEEGYRTQAVADGAAALQAFEEHTPALVITDVRMPGLNGLDLLSRVKALNPEIPLIVISAFANVDDAVEAMKLGAADYVLKPLKPEELKLGVRRALERQQLVVENRRLRNFAAERFGFDNIIAHSRKMRAALEVAAQVARHDSTVLISGESGTGKELLAKAIHQNSLRAAGPFITVNCGALPEALAESELFGHRKGAFTGAIADRIGKFEAANQGTIFLDEVGELTPPLQVKLLRVIQEREVDKLGQPTPVRVNLRLIAGSNRNLRHMIDDREFRDDLFYRLSVVTIDLPPLRDRRDDIPLLAQHFLAGFAERYGSALQLSAEALERLAGYDWPGNVRELQNVIERACVLARQPTIGLADLPDEVRQSEARVTAIGLRLPDDGIDLEEIEKEILLQALDKHGWNQTRAAKYLNISRKTLIYRMEKFSLVAPSGSDGDGLPDSRSEPAGE